MSEDAKTERINKYKENRRKQLAAQFGEQHGTKESCSSSSSEGPKTTRASRLRAAKTAQENATSNTPSASAKFINAEKTTPTYSERDKSSKRKSNLNRSHNSEEVIDSDDPKNRRRRRRFFPPEILDQATSPSPNKTSSPNTASPIASRNSPNRRSDLSIHMENARKGITTAYSEMGAKYRPFSASPREKIAPLKNGSDSNNSTNSERDNNKENTKNRRVGVISKVSSVKKTDSPTSQSQDQISNEVTRKMEELTALTRETLARVEKLAVLANSSESSTKSSRTQQQIINNPVKRHSILKKKSVEEPPHHHHQVSSETQPLSAAPVSILKRKVSQDEKEKSDTHTPPVTFSPSVIDRVSSSVNPRRQGILKKRRSLDESQVMRHRSCSPDVANAQTPIDSRCSILKNQRRSSLEELTRAHSPEAQLQGILKRKTSKTEDEDYSLNSPQSILKRRSGASSAGSTGGSPHVSITTAVILAAAGGAEMVLEESAASLKPSILKKKSFSEENSSHCTDFAYYGSETPKPILKKKSSTDTDDGDERPKRPILKSSSRNSSERDNTSFENNSAVMNNNSDFCDIFEDTTTIRPILKQQMNSGEESSKPRLSFSHDQSNTESGSFRGRRSTICTTLKANSGANLETRQEDRDMKKPRPLSVSQLVMSFETTTTSVGTVPKTYHHSANKRSLRYKTQPVTSDELQMSLNLLQEQQQFSPRIHEEQNSSLKTFLNSTSPGGPKSSSDSAFQSLGDGLESDQDTEKSVEMLGNKSALEQQMKKIAEEAKKRRLGGGAEAGSSLLRSRKTPSDRFSTQPVTFDEVQEASKLSTNKEEDEGGNIDKKKGILKHTHSTRAPTKTSSSPAADETRQNLPADEGISCNDSGSDSEISKSENTTSKKHHHQGGDTTSDGDSSGGREVRSIFKTEKKQKFKQSLENILSKSKSQSQCSAAALSSGGEVEDAARISPASALSKATNIRRSQTQSAMPRSIQEIQVKLQESGESGWKKRFQQSSSDEIKLLQHKNKYNEELSEKSIKTKKDELDAAAKQWKSRVEKSDAQKFSVAARMEKEQQESGGGLSINIHADKNTKKTPQPKRFGVKTGSSESSSTPSSPEKNLFGELSRSQSVPDPENRSINKTVAGDGLEISGRKVTISRPDDFTFTNFFKSVDERKVSSNKIDYVDLADFDSVQRHSLLVQKKNVQVQKRRGTTRNPIKALASRTDIVEEYTEVLTGLAEREKRRLNVEKLAKGSNLAVEALAGLASKEDFKSVTLKTPTAPSLMVPFKDVMLLQVKGRRHVQTRLVEPTVASLNEGDNFILVTGNSCYTYTGAYSNIIEQSRAADIVNHIQQTGDLGCKNAKFIQLNSDLLASKEAQKFLQILNGSENEIAVTGGGHPDEDEVYETNIVATNMIYGLEDDELVPLNEFWGTVPKFEMLQGTKMYVFDFGSEMYVWSGKNAALDKKRKMLKLAKDLWEHGYDYSECSVNPLNVAGVLGKRDTKNAPVKLSSGSRPDWALFAKITQHRETILFKEKFLDWPDFSRIIRVKSEDGNDKSEISASYNITPCDAEKMLKQDVLKKEPDLVVEGYHLGRGSEYFDEETRRFFEFESLDMTVWKILENTSEKLTDEQIGHFFDSDSYIIRWNFKMTVKGRELSGKPSKFVQAGRDRSIFFCWQGRNSSINEKGLAALLTIELDIERAPQIRVVQGSEPAAFLRLFNGQMMVHKGKRCAPESPEDSPRLFMVKGELEDEASAIEVLRDSSALRSRTSFILADPHNYQLILWHGSKSGKQSKKAAQKMARKLSKQRPVEVFPAGSEDAAIVEVDEGDEDDDLKSILSLENREKYCSLMGSELDFNFTMRMFYLSSISGVFEATEMLCPHRSEFCSPFPFTQNDLYSASQPALFLIDNHHELYLWQGWWPEQEEVDLQDQTGSGKVRWQSERKAAMQTAVDYWRKTHPDSQESGEEDEEIPAYLVWAGLEPLDFKNLFPCWTEREDVAEINLAEGREADAKMLLERVLSKLQRTKYPLEELLSRPLPEGVDPTHLEIYLSAEDFEEALSMSREEFQKLPIWKQTALKKDKGLF